MLARQGGVASERQMTSARPGDSPEVAPWLPTLTSLMFFAEAAWRIAAPGTSAPQRASAYFNAANFLALGMLGLCCVYWPTLSKWLPRRDENEIEIEDKTQQVELENSPSLRDTEQRVVVESGEATPSDEGGGRPDGAPEGPDAVPRGQQTEDVRPAAKAYLSSLTAFLVFMTVTNHVVKAFSEASLDRGLPQTEGVESFVTGAAWFLLTDQKSFIATLFLLSGLYCPEILDRKGLRGFVINAQVRLGGAWVLYSALLGPLTIMWGLDYLSLPLKYLYSSGPTWAVLWPLNFSIAYALIAQIAPTVKWSMPHPFVLLLAGLALSGVFYGMTVAAGDSRWNYFGTMNKWNYAVALYVPFFTVGVVGGRNDWLKSVEEMPAWVVWPLRLIVLGFWVTFFLATAQVTIPIPGLSLDSGLVDSIAPPLYATVVSLNLLFLFNRISSSGKVSLSLFPALYLYLDHDLTSHLSQPGSKQVHEQHGRRSLLGLCHPVRAHECDVDLLDGDSSRRGSTNKLRGHHLLHL